MSNPIPIPSPVPIPHSAHHAGSSSQRASSIGRSLSTRRSSQSQGASGLGRRPSRVTHPPPVPTRALSHDEALDALRGFLKERSSYDVFPVSFRLIVLDTTLKVKKALDVMLLYSKFNEFTGGEEGAYDRCGFCSSMGYEFGQVCGYANIVQSIEPGVADGQECLQSRTSFILSNITTTPPAGKMSHPTSSTSG